MPKRKTTDERIEELARIVKAGFDEVATKHEVRAGFDAVTSSLDLIRQDIHDIKLVQGPLVRSVAHTERVLQEHERRIERLERRAGVTK